MFKDSACYKLSPCSVMSLYSVSKGVSSGACSNRGKHILVVVTYAAMSVSVNAYVLVDVVIYEDYVLSKSSVV